MRYRHWTKEDVIEELKALAANGIPMNSTALKHDHSAVENQCRRLFRSVREAVEAAGLEYQSKRTTRVWTHAEVRSELMRLHAMGIKMSPKAVREVDYSLVIAAANYFSSFGNAVEATGLRMERVEHKRKWTQERVIAELQARHQRNESMSINEVCKGNSALVSAAVRRFGKWSAALNAAGVSR